MKKRIFALALALCMMVSVMPNSFAAGILSVGNGTSTDTTVPSGGSILSVGGNTSTQLSNTGALQNSILSNGSSAQPLDDGTGETGEEPVVDNSGALDDGEDTNESSTAIHTKLENNSSVSGSTSLTTDAKNGLELSKTVADDKIKLEAWVTGEEVTVTVKEGEPVEIVLVLDRSARMLVTAENGKTKMENLQIAAKNFLNAVREKSPNSRVAIVSYANEGGSTVDTGVAGNDGVRPAAVGALVPITGINEETGLEEVNNELSGAIGDLEASGNAYSDEALGKAAKILQDLTTKEPTNDHKRMVILFTAGIPGSSSNTSWNNTAYKIAQASIHWGVILKADTTTSVTLDANQEFYSGSLTTDDMAQYTGYTQGCAASVFCVGIDLDDCVSGHYHGSADAACNGTKINEYLYRISSHRQDGSHVGCKFDVAHLLLCSQKNFYNAWESEPKNATFLIWTKTCWTFNYLDQYTRGNVTDSKVTGTKYYQAGDIEDVGSMFKEISNDITTGGSSNETLTASTVVQDVLSQYFQIPADGTVTAYSVAYTGKDAAGNLTWEEKATATYTPDIQGNEVTVQGFNFSENWVGTSSGNNHGQKLVIEIDIEPKDGFLGGQGIPTNDDANAGVYLGETLVENFPSADAKTTVAIPDITVDVKGKNVYYSNALTDAEMLADATVMIGEVALDLTQKNFGLEEWQYAYLSKIEIVTSEDADAFNATCTVTDKASGTKSGTDATPAQITVFKPHISFKDSTIHLGEIANYANNNGVPLVVWKDVQGNVAVPANMTGTRPSVKVTYSIENQNELYFTDCTNIGITAVELNGVVKDAYLGATRFWNGDTETTGNDHQFKVHVLYPSVSYNASTVQLGYAPGETYYKANNLVKTSEGKTIVTWADKHGDHGISSVTNNDDSNFTYSFTPKDTSLTDCTSVEATIAIKVNNVDVTADTDVFTVHVVRPTITFADQVIHLSKQPDYIDLRDADEAKAFAWDSSCAQAQAHTDIPAVTGAVDVANFELAYSVAETATFLDCTDVDVTVLFGEDDYTSYVTLKNGTDTRGKDLAEFTVHVLKPDFTVAVTDLHADYGTPVGLDHKIEDQTVQAVNCSYAWKCATADCDDVKTVSNLTGESVAIGQVLYSITCDPADAEALTKDGETNQWTYLVNETDTTFTVELVGFKIGSDVYDESTHRAGVTFTNEDSEFVIYTNKFDLTINKEWKDGEKAADGTYKQDAIFTVAHGQDTFKVVLPAGQSNVKVTGLLCGQTYTVSEDNAWTWRWSSKDAEQEFTGASHDVSAEDPHRKMTDAKHVEEVSFTNNLFNRFWLSFCTFIANIFQKGGN